MWSKSVWAWPMQRSMAGSITDRSSARNSALPATVPVSTRSGSLPCSTNALMSGERAEGGNLGGGADDVDPGCGGEARGHDGASVVFAGAAARRQPSGARAWCACLAAAPCGGWWGHGDFAHVGIQRTSQTGVARVPLPCRSNVQCHAVDGRPPSSVMNVNCSRSPPAPCRGTVLDAPPGPDRVVADERGVLGGRDDVGFPLGAAHSGLHSPITEGRRPWRTACPHRRRCRAKRNRWSTTNILGGIAHLLGFHALKAWLFSLP